MYTSFVSLVPTPLNANLPFLKAALKVLAWYASMSPFAFAFTASTKANPIPFNADLILENRKKSQGPREGECNGRSNTVMLCLARNVMTDLSCVLAPRPDERSIACSTTGQAPVFYLVFWELLLIGTQSTWIMPMISKNMIIIDLNLNLVWREFSVVVSWTLPILWRVFGFRVVLKLPCFHHILWRILEIVNHLQRLAGCGPKWIFECPFVQVWEFSVPVSNTFCSCLSSRKQFS